MKRELRGRNIKKFHLVKMKDIRRVYDAFTRNEVDEDDLAEIEKEYGCDIRLFDDEKELSDAIRKSILSLYNEDISESIMLIYFFIKWYKKATKSLEKQGQYENRLALLEFDNVLNKDVIQNINKYLNIEYDKNCLDKHIIAFQYKLVAELKARITSGDKETIYELIVNDIFSIKNNCKFLHFIDGDGDIDGLFLLEWEYYSVDKVFRDVVDTFDSEINRPIYNEIKGNEFKYFEKIKKAEVDFSSIKALSIIKDGKNRTVYTANKPIDQVTLTYLSKRLNYEFKIAYPNRDKIMEQSFNLIDSLPRLDNYTIYKFDFKDFFDSVEIKKVYDGYIKKSNLYSYEKEILLKLAKKYKFCVQGLPISNSLIEIISRNFDKQVMASFSEDGLIFYKRYVDDCILIFNHRVENKKLNNVIDLCRKAVYGNKVTLASGKTCYQTKLDGKDSFDYLGYSFTRCFWDKCKKDKDKYYYFQFGIAPKKIEKYKKQLDAMFNLYENSGDERILLRRIQYFNSRIVFYNYNGSKYVNKSTWDVRGIINSYRMLRRYIIYESQNRESNDAGVKVPYRIESETYKFLRYFIKEKRNKLSIIPQYLQGKGCENHSLWNGFLKNKSIVFQPNIGWGNSYLSDRLIELGISTVHKSYYEMTRDYYTTLIKKL